MTSKEKRGLEQWSELHGADGQDASELRKIWDATGQYRAQFQPDTDKGLQKLKARMSADTGSGRVVRLNPARRLLRIAAAAALLIAAVFVLKMFVKGPSASETLTAGTDAQKSMMLDDGTAVTLNESSSLTFPQHFTQKERRVALTGEAFFDVAENPAKPFIVETDLADVKVLGTSFNIRAYPSEETIEVFVKTGIVAVKVKGAGNAVTLNPGDKLVFEKKQNKIVSAKDAPANSVAWKEGKLTFKQKRFQVIFSEIERQFGVQVEVNDPKLLDCIYTMTIEKEKVQEDLRSLSVSCPVTVNEINPKHFVVSGKCCE